jgi:hypothetical protein
MAPDNYMSWIIELKVYNSCGWSSVPETYYINRGYPCYGGYSYSIYPNPSNDEVTIEAIPDESTKEFNPSFTIDFTVELYDSNKLMIGEGVSKDNMVKINMGNVKNGLYFVQITDKNQVLKKQLIIE